MVSVGNIVADKLNAAGITTLHDTTEHDYPKYTGSYSRAAKTINGYLKKYPSIKIVLDLHRDAAANGNDKIKLTTEIGGKRAAQVMLVMGSQSGSQTHFPNWKENLKLALRLQQTLENKYPAPARPLSLTSSGYNLEKPYKRLAAYRVRHRREHRGGGALLRRACGQRACGSA